MMVSTPSAPAATTPDTPSSETTEPVDTASEETNWWDDFFGGDDEGEGYTLLSNIDVAKAIPTFTPNPSVKPVYTPSPTQPVNLGQPGYRKYKNEVHILYDYLMEAREEVKRAQKSQDVDRMTEANAYFRKLYDIMCEELGIKKVGEYSWDYPYWNDPEFNEVKVDFR